jgi:antitoxin VapB
MRANGDVCLKLSPSVHKFLHLCKMEERRWPCPSISRTNGRTIWRGRFSIKTGESLTTAVILALEERLRRVSPQEDRAARLARINEILDRAASYPVLDNRTPDEIIGYDENGLPS